MPTQSSISSQTLSSSISFTQINNVYARWGDGYNGYNTNENGCCSGGDCQAPSGCVIDQLGGDIGAALMETDLVST